MQQAGSDANFEACVSSRQQEPEIAADISRNSPEQEQTDGRSPGKISAGSNANAAHHAGSLVRN